VDTRGSNQCRVGELSRLSPSPRQRARGCVADGEYCCWRTWTLRCSVLHRSIATFGARRMAALRSPSAVGVSRHIQFIPGVGAPTAMVVTQALARLDDSLPAHQPGPVATRTLECERHLREANRSTAGPKCRYEAPLIPMTHIASTWFGPARCKHRRDGSLPSIDEAINEL
jgi:hypothetical protein